MKTKRKLKLRNTIEKEILRNMADEYIKTKSCARNFEVRNLEFQTTHETFYYIDEFLKENDFYIEDIVVHGHKTDYSHIYLKNICIDGIFRLVFFGSACEDYDNLHCGIECVCPVCGKVLTKSKTTNGRKGGMKGKSPKKHLEYNCPEDHVKVNIPVPQFSRIEMYYNDEGDYKHMTHFTYKVPCPNGCGGHMKLINGTRGSFYGCSGYPSCKTTMSVSDYDRVQNFKNNEEDLIDVGKDLTIHALGSHTSMTMHANDNGKTDIQIRMDNIDASMLDEMKNVLSDEAYNYLKQRMFKNL